MPNVSTDSRYSTGESVLQKVGGWSAWVAAMTVVVGLGMFVTVVSDYAAGDLDASESVAFLLDNQAVLYVWNFVTLIVFSVALVPLVISLHRLLSWESAALSHVGLAFGLIWSGLLVAAGMILNVGSATLGDLSEVGSSELESTWIALDTVANGLSGGMEIVGPIWVLLVSMAAWQGRTLPRPLNYLGFVIAVAGLTTIVPSLEAVGAIFGLGLVVWLAWLGTVMLRPGPSHTG